MSNTIVSQPRRISRVPKRFLATRRMFVPLVNVLALGRAGYGWSELAPVLATVTGGLAGFTFLVFVTLIFHFLRTSSPRDIPTDRRRRRAERNDQSRSHTTTTAAAGAITAEARHRLFYLLPATIIELLAASIMWSLIAGLDGKPITQS